MTICSGVNDLDSSCTKDASTPGDRNIILLAESLHGPATASHE